MEKMETSQIEDFWTTFSKGIQNLSSHWASYTVLFSFFLYLLGYLALRFHLAVLGVGTDLSVIDERYLFVGNKFLIYTISSIPSLILLVTFFLIVLMAPVYVLKWFLSLIFPVKIGNFYRLLRQNLKKWFIESNLLVWIGIVITLLMIQLVMKQCIILSNMNLLLAEDLPAEPAWLRFLLLAQTDEPMTLYFIGLLGGTLVPISIFFYTVRNGVEQTKKPEFIRTLFGFLLGVQLLLLPVNYGILVLDKSMPRVTGLDVPGIIKQDEQAWMVWEGNEGKTFLLREPQENGYKKSLITLPKGDVKRLVIVGYDHIFKFLFSNNSLQEKG